MTERVELPGFAPIKKEFILNTEHIGFDDKLLVKQQQNGKRAAEDTGDAPEDGSKKQKQSGQNKHRRNVMIKQQRDATRNRMKMCLAFCRENKCQYGDNCTFSHDIARFIETEREPDISDTCYVYKTFGKCQFGVRCRFGMSHISEDGKKNLFDESITPESIEKTTMNNFGKDMCQSLRKREYDFKLANETAAKINKNDVDFSPVMKEPKNVQLKKKLDFKGKLYLAPLTTVGNLPFRRVCKELGADITCSEMAMCSNILQAQQSELALLRRHSSEDFFGVQICGSNVDQLARCSQLLSQECDIDFIDLNMGCPIDLVYKTGAGSGLMDRSSKLNKIIYAMTQNLDVPLTLKMRTGIHKGENNAHKLMSVVQEWGSDRIGAVTIHGRTREQRYTRSADWNYIGRCADIVHCPDDPTRDIPIFGSGDIMSHEEYYEAVENNRVDGVMFARGALIKPWIFTEVKERRTWDISSSERFDLLKKYTNYGLEHWGSDSTGVEKTRRFMLEWLSFLYRYIPVGLLERLPQRINERPPKYMGRDDLETLMASPSCNDWIAISEMLLGKVPDGFTFLPKHRANAY